MAKENELETMGLGKVVEEIAQLTMMDVLDIANSVSTIGRPYSTKRMRLIRQTELYRELDRRELEYQGKH